MEGLIRMEYLDMVYGDKNIYSTPKIMLKWDAALRARCTVQEIHAGQCLYAI